MAECLLAMREYRNLADHGIASYDLDQMLNLDVAYLERRPWPADEAYLARDDKDGSEAVEDAKSEILRACLQIAAATLIDQKMQISRGEVDLSSALRSWKDAAEKRRAYYRSMQTSSAWLATRQKQRASRSKKA